MTLPTHPALRPAASRGALARVLIGCWLAIHVLIMAAAPIVDALQGHGSGVVAHWEDVSDDRCPPQHDELGCQLAPVIHAAGIGSASPAVTEAHWAARAAARPLAADRDGREAQRAAPSSRGPPTA